MLVLVGGAVLFFASRDSSDSSDTTGSASDLEAPSGDLDASCHSLHEGHAAMAWNPTSADEMVEADCGWPYEPYLVPTEGGEEDPAIEAAFEPRLYRELSDVLGDAGLGLCSVNALPEDPGDGFVFGFRYDAAEPGCPDFEPSVQLTAREYVSRAHRDTAADSASEANPIVLGRWVLTTDGPDQDRVDQVTAALIDLGGQAVAER